jgi:hypothetical protein
LSFVKNYGSSIRRFLVATVTGLWLGGFTFYAAVVIKVGEEVLGDHRPVGFITQEVSRSLNAIGVLALVLLLWNMIAVWTSSSRWTKHSLTVSWIVMATAQLCLFAIHPMLDGTLSSSGQEILNYNGFIGLHRAYLAVSTAQWCAGLLHVWCLVIAACSFE